MHRRGGVAEWIDPPPSGALETGELNLGSLHVIQGLLARCHMKKVQCAVTKNHD